MPARMSFLRYIGAKHRLAPAIAEHLKATGAGTLVDVFGGSGAVIMNAGFRKRIYNDIDGDLVCLFRIIADPIDRPKLLKQCKWMPPSRQLYEEDHRIYIKGGLSFRLIPNKIDRARAIFYRSNYAFGGKVRSGGFQVSYADRDPIKEVSRWENLLRRFVQVGEFWRGTVIENKHYSEVISNYGRSAQAVLYFDPPYDGTEMYYSAAFTSADHTFLAHQLADMKANAVGTYYDTPLVRSLYPEDRWEYHEIAQNQNLNITMQKKKVKQLILVKR